MSRETEEKLKDFAVWFKEHVKEINDIEQRTRFLERAMDNMLWLTTFLIEDIQRLEGRAPGQETGLIVPAHIRRENQVHGAPGR